MNSNTLGKKNTLSTLLLETVIKLQSDKIIKHWWFENQVEGDRCDKL